MTSEEAVRVVREQTIPALCGSGGDGHAEALRALLDAHEERGRDLDRIKFNLRTEGVVPSEWMRRAEKAEALAEERGREVERLRAEPRFVSYDVVRCAEPVNGKPARYHVYGITSEGIKVGLDYLYLREHDNALKQAEARLAKVRRERDDWRHAAEKGAALCRAVTNDLMDDMDWFDSAKDLYDEVISLAAKAKVAAAQPEDPHE